MGDRDYSLNAAHTPVGRTARCMPCNTPRFVAPQSGKMSLNRWIGKGLSPLARPNWLTQSDRITQGLDWLKINNAQASEVERNGGDNEGLIVLREQGR